MRPAQELEVSYFFANSYEEILQWKDKFVSEGREGIVVKNPSPFYGQRKAWLKLNAYDSADCFVTRLEETQEMQRTGIPHSWFLGVYDDNDESGNVLEVGKVGTYLKEMDPKEIGDRNCRRGSLPGSHRRPQIQAPPSG